MKKYYSYELFREDTKQLAQKLLPKHYDTIVAISRGGLTLAHSLAEALGIRDVQTVRTELYDKQTKREQITLFGSCQLQPSCRVLVVDDIADSGETLEVVMKHLQKEYPNVTFESATLFYKPTSVYEPTFWMQEAKGWIEFFWEVDCLVTDEPV